MSFVSVLLFSDQKFNSLNYFFKLNSFLQSSEELAVGARMAH